MISTVKVNALGGAPRTTLVQFEKIPSEAEARRGDTMTAMRSFGPPAAALSRPFGRQVHWIESDDGLGAGIRVTPSRAKADSQANARQ